MGTPWKTRTVAILLISLGLLSCADRIPEDALRLSPESLAIRQLQSRSFDTREEAAILSAGAGVLQDLGFNLDESETELGVIVGSKRRDATEVGQIAGAIVMAVLFGAYIPTDEEQKIRASLVTKPSGEGEGRIVARVTFQRIVWDSDGEISKIEAIEDPEIYQEFFSKLSKAVFLEANQV